LQGSHDSSKGSADVGETQERPWQEPEQRITPRKRRFRELGFAILLFISVVVIMVAVGEISQGGPVRVYLVAFLLLGAFVPLALFSFRSLWRVWTATRIAERVAAQETLVAERTAARQRSASHIASGADKTVEEEPSLLFEGRRMDGPGTYRFEEGKLVLCGRALPTEWPGSLFLNLLICPLHIVLFVSITPIGYLLVLKGYQVLFRREEDLVIERSNVKWVDSEGTRVTLRLSSPIGRGIYGNIKKIIFVVAEYRCPVFFAEFNRCFPKMLPPEYVTSLES